MSIYWLRTSLDGHTLDPIELPYFHLASAADMWTGKDDGPQSMPTGAVQFLARDELALSPANGQRYVVVLSGTLKLALGDIKISRGGSVLVEPQIDLGSVAAPDSDCRLLVVHVSDWTPRIVTGDARRKTASVDEPRPNFKWLYSGEDGEAYFADFTELFDTAAGWGATVRKAYDTMFLEQGDGFFMDWHPEGANNIVVITSGCLELEAGPDRIERFYPGDVCFAVDRTGKGHIDRAFGATSMATIIIPSKTFDAPTGRNA